MSRGKVFVCYARRDEAATIKVVAALRSRGVPVWMDLRDVVVEKDVWPQIQSGLQNCCALLWVSAAHTALTRWTALELSLAHALHLPCFAVDLCGLSIEDQVDYVSTCIDRLR